MLGSSVDTKRAGVTGLQTCRQSDVDVVNLELERAESFFFLLRGVGCNPKVGLHLQGLVLFQKIG